MTEVEFSEDNLSDDVVQSTDHEQEGFKESGGVDGYETPTPVYEKTGTDEYQTSEPHSTRGDSADEIDPRKLVKDPTLNELRWYYNRTFAKVLVNKPVEDAFKHGYEIESENPSEIKDVIHNEDYDYEETYRTARKKARRDGFSLLFIGFKSAANNLDTADKPENVTGISHLKVLTVDDLTDCAKQRIDDDVPLDTSDYSIRESGIVVNKNLNTPDFNEPIGYVLDASPEPQFIYKDWVQHIVANPEVDGDYDPDAINTVVQDYQDSLGRWEGESELTACYDLLKWLKKANWSIGQTLFRYASKMYAVKLPDDATDEDWEAANSELRNMNSKSEIILPSNDYEVEDFETDGQLEPREYFDILFEQICACTEMTKSVLFGTQQGTVTGSETDIKNYFNQVERERVNAYEVDFKDFVQRASDVNTAEGSTLVSNVAAGSFDMSWNPLFKLSELDRVEAMRTEANALTMLINNYALTPDEARSVLTEEWAEFDLDGLTEEQRDLLDRTNLTSVGAYKGAERAEEENENQESLGNPRRQNGGGREQGSTNAGNNPTTDDDSESKSW